MSAAVWAMVEHHRVPVSRLACAAAMPNAAVRLAIRLTMLGCAFEVRQPPALVELLRVLGAGVTPHGPRLSAASRSVRLAGTAHGGVALQIPSGRCASSQPACTNR